MNADTTKTEETTLFADAAAASAAQTEAPLAAADTPPDPSAAREQTVEERAKAVAASYGLTDVEYAVLQKTTCKDAPREIAAWFMLFCKHRGLDPFSKQVYLYNEKRDNTGQWNVVTGIDGLRVIASRSPYFRGQLKPEWSYEIDDAGDIQRFDGAESKNGKIAGKRIPEDCTVVARRAIPQAPADASLYLEFYGIARFDEFVKRDYNGKIYGNWESQPEHQLRIRAEAMALRMAFPEEVGGIYLEDEIREQDPVAITSAPALPPATRDDIDDQIESLRKELGYTQARLLIERGKAGGGREGLRDALLAQLEAKENATPKGGTRGAAAATEPIDEAQIVTPPAPEPEPVVPAIDPEPEEEPIIKKDRCAACLRKKGTAHVAGCPIDEEDDNDA